ARALPSFASMRLGGGPVNGGTAPTLFRVVDDVVVDQHPALEMFERRRRAQGGTGISPRGEVIAGEDENRSKSLAPPQCELAVYLEIRSDRRGSEASRSTVRSVQLPFERRQKAVEGGEVHGRCIWTSMLFNGPGFRRRDGVRSVRYALERGRRGNGSATRCGEADPRRSHASHERRIPLLFSRRPEYRLARNDPPAAGGPGECSRPAGRPYPGPSPARLLSGDCGSRRDHRRGSSLRGARPPARPRSILGRGAARPSGERIAPSPSQRPTTRWGRSPGPDLARLGRPRARPSVLSPGIRTETGLPAREDRHRPVAARPRSH